MVSNLPRNSGVLRSIDNANSDLLSTHIFRLTIIILVRNRTIPIVSADVENRWSTFGVRAHAFLYLNGGGNRFTQLSPIRSIFFSHILAMGALRSNKFPRNTDCYLIPRLMPPGAADGVYTVTARSAHMCNSAAPPKTSSPAKWLALWACVCVCVPKPHRAQRSHAPLHWN